MFAKILNGRWGDVRISSRNTRAVKRQELHAGSASGHARAEDIAQIAKDGTAQRAGPDADACELVHNIARLQD